MTLTIADDIAHFAEQIASAADVSPKHRLQALQSHFSPITPELQWEFDAWERASDEDMVRLDVVGGLGW